MFSFKDNIKCTAFIRKNKDVVKLQMLGGPSGTALPSPSARRFSVR